MLSITRVCMSVYPVRPRTRVVLVDSAGFKWCVSIGGTYIKYLERGRRGGEREREGEKSGKGEGRREREIDGERRVKRGRGGERWREKGRKEWKGRGERREREEGREESEISKCSWT